jgi:hypothetical protein
MGGENLTAFGQPVTGDNEYQYPIGFQPAIRMAQERLLGSATVSRPQCPIIGGIQIQEAKAFDWALHFQRISLGDVGNLLPGLLSAEGIKLNTVAKNLSTICDNLERHAITNTRVDRGRRRARELEEPPNSLGFGQWQRVEAETTFALEAQGGLLSQRNSYGVGLR